MMGKVRWSELWKKYKFVLLVVLVGVMLMLLPVSSGTEEPTAEARASEESFDLEAEERRMEELARLTAQLPHVRLRGLMAIPPVSLEIGSNRPYFQAMRQLFVDIKEKMSDNQTSIDCLSMGMSGDYADAIAEGSTLVRVGTALFGPRPPMGTPRTDIHK